MARYRTLLAAAVLLCSAYFPTLGADKLAVEPGITNGRLLRIQVDGHWGYCDTSGSVVVEPKYRWAQDFSDGLALVSIDDKLAYIDRSGSVVARPPFTHDHSPFVNGFARGSIGLEFRFLRKNGALLATAFAGSRDFSEGLAAVCIDPARFSKKLRAESPLWEITGKWGFIDASGELVIKAEYIAVEPFSDGLAAVYVGGRNVMCSGPCEGKWGFINRHGEVVIKPQFVSAMSFSEGLAAVSLDGKSIGYINTSGEFAIQPRPFASARSFQDGVARIRGSDELGSPGWKDFGYIDKSGKVFVHLNFSEGEPFSEGLAVAREKPVWNPVQGKWVQGLYGYVNKQGEWQIRPQFTKANLFSDGVACVQNKTGLGYVNIKGEFIWRPTK